MSEDIEIRLGGPRDTTALVEFNCEMARETESKALDVSTVTAGVAGLIARSDRGFYVVASQRGEIVGSLMITTEWSDWRNGEIWWLQSVYVSKRLRREGVYRQLHEYVRDLARQQKVIGLRLYVERDNEPAQETYRALGMGESSYLMFEEFWA